MEVPQASFIEHITLGDLHYTEGYKGLFYYHISGANISQTI